jgi:hypothetical protein
MSHGLYDELLRAHMETRKRPAALARVRALCLPRLVTTVRASRDGPGSWQPDDTGKTWLLVPVLDGPQITPYAPGAPRDACGRTVPLVDLLAWRPDEEEPLLRRGSVAALGEWCLGWPSGDPVTLCATPASWFAAGPGAVYVIDWPSVAADLLNTPEIIAETVELGETAERHIQAERRRQTPVAPKIGVLAS